MRCNMSLTTMLVNKKQHMKYIILFLALPFFAFGQNDIVSDSSYLKWENNAWFRVSTQTYSNGDISIRQSYVGDTATLYTQAVDGIRNQTASMAVDANYTSGFPKTLRTIINQSDEILAKAGKSPIDSIETADAAAFLQSGWVVKNGGEVAITFNQTAAKKLRYQYVTTTNRQVDLMGSVIRLRDFPANGVTTDFYRSSNGKRWVTIDRAYQLIPAGGSANR
jgi:hypothetical protein